MCKQMADVKVGDVLTRVGVTRHSPITVTGLTQTFTGAIRVEGFNALNSEPRMMFRGLAPKLIVEVGS